MFTYLIISGSRHPFHESSKNEGNKLTKGIDRFSNIYLLFYLIVFSKVKLRKSKRQDQNQVNKSYYMKIIT